MQVISISLLMIGVVLGFDESAADPLKQDDETAAVRKWIERAETHAAKCPDEDDRYMHWRVMADLYVQLGDLGRVYAMMDRVKKENRPDFCRAITFRLAQTRDGDLWLRFVENIKDPKERDAALEFAVRGHCARHDFAEAKRVIELFSDPDRAAPSWDVVATHEAAAGHYDAALESSRKFVFRNAKLQFDSMEDRVNLQKHIAECRAGKRRDKNEPRATTAAGQYRSLLGLFDMGHTDLQDLARKEAEAAKFDNPYVKAGAWRRIAWVYHDRDNPQKSRQALEHAIDATRQIPDPYQRSLNETLIADLLIELGETAQAKQLAIDAAKRGEKGLLPGLARFTTGPVIVGVMVRCGEIDNVYEVLVEADDGLAWTAFAEFCVDEGKLDLVKKRLPTIESEDAKASICLGVATALLRRSEAE